MTKSSYYIWEAEIEGAASAPAVEAAASAPWARRGLPLRMRLVALPDGEREEHVRAARAAHQARRRAAIAAEHGLRYPALLEEVPVRAAVLAERARARFGSPSGATPGARAGFDSQGHYGPGVRHVSRAWFIAGCGGSRTRERKFQLVLAAFGPQDAGSMVRKGDTLPFARNLIRGARWAARNAPGVCFARKTLAALGRLSAEARHWAVRAIVGAHRPSTRCEWGPYPYHGGCAASQEAPIGGSEAAPSVPFLTLSGVCAGAEKERLRLPGSTECPARIRDLDWSAVRELHRLRAMEGVHAPRARAPRALARELRRLAESTHLRGWTAEALAALPRSPHDKALALRSAALPGRAARRLRGLADDGVSQKFRIRAEWLGPYVAPAYPGATLAMALRVAAGKSPAEIFGGRLSPAEAHEAIAAGWATKGTSPEQLEHDASGWLMRGLPSQPPSAPAYVAVARWLRAQAARPERWAALTRERTQREPGGVVRRFRFLDHIDSLAPEDLDGGRAGVVAAFTAAMRRAGEVLSADTRVIAVPPSGWPVLPPWARFLGTPAELAREGREMKHCVAGYVPAVRDGFSRIVSLDWGGVRSTLDLRSDGLIAQHRGVRNADVDHPIHVAFAEALSAAARKGNGKWI